MSSMSDKDANELNILAQRSESNAPDLCSAGSSTSSLPKVLFRVGVCACVCARASACVPVSWCNLDASIDNCIPVASDEQ